MDSQEIIENAAIEQPTENNVEVQNETPVVAETPVEAPEETPVETPVEAPEETPVETPVEAPEETPALPLMKTREDVVAHAKELAEGETLPEKTEIDLLKQLYYKYNGAVIAEAKKAFVEAGGNVEEFTMEPDALDEEFRTAMNTIREKRAQAQAEQEKQKQENLSRKLAILEHIQKLASTPEEANSAFDEFKNLQAEWKEIKAVPAERATELWKNFQLYVEQYYDLLKLGHELREYDFKKNLEIKTALCEKAEALDKEEDVVSAFNQLQSLHQEWKETGPVAKELREDIWNRFKEASTVINKKHQAHFEALKANEENNLQKKTALCERVEGISTEGLTTFAQWEEMTQQVLASQTDWRTIGYAPQKFNTTIFERFRAACDAFFTKKAEFYKAVKESLNENFARKKELADKAEALKDSTDWKATTDALIELQKQWKEIGAVPKKYSEQLWQRFIGSCDAFFEAKQKATSGEREQQKENLQKKRDIIAELKKLAEEGAENIIDKVKELQQQWNEVGHVPFKEKDKVYKEYREICDKIYGDARSSRIANRAASRIQYIQENLGNDRQRLMRAYESLKSEIKTYENNLGFLNSSNKKGNALVDQIRMKVETLKQELAAMEKKLKEEA